MAKGVCVVCGTVGTVKTHLFPRALMLDMRADAKALYTGNRLRDGYLEKQNGRWDDRFLCAEHEAMLGPADEYAVKLCRKIADVPPPPRGPIAIDVDNPRPELFAKFVYACVWRHVMAPTNAELSLELGPYEKPLRAALFETGPLDLQILASVSGFTTKRGPTNLAIEPYRQRLDGIAIWHFIIGRLNIYLKTDARPFADGLKALLADRNPLTLVVDDETDIATAPLLQPIADRIRASSKRRR